MYAGIFEYEGECWICLNRLGIWIGNDDDWAGAGGIKSRKY